MATLEEMERVYSLDDALRLNAMLDMRDAHEAHARDEAEKKAKR